MVLDLAGAAGLDPDQLYFNIETVGNTSSGSIPLAIADAKAEGVIKEPLRVFAPGYGAGAVGGCAVLRIDPAVIAPEPATSSGARATPDGAATAVATASTWSSTISTPRSPGCRARAWPSAATWSPDPVGAKSCSPTPTAT
jgi:3-oxoacyl-[acyl-carrier-protein] synthase III